MQKSFHTEESKVWRSKVSFIVILYRNHFIQKSFCTEIILYRRMRSLTLENPRPFQSQLYSHLIQKSFYTEIIYTEECNVWYWRIQGLSKVSSIGILCRNHLIQKNPKSDSPKSALLSFYTEIILYRNQFYTAESRVLQSQLCCHVTQK